MTYLKILLLVTFANLFAGIRLFAQQPVLSNGTIIITLTSADTIWVGADSRTSALTENGYTVNKQGMCKIYSTDHVVYAMAGHVRYVDNSFNFVEMMQGCINAENDFDRSMDLFQAKAKDEIAAILRKFSVRSINTLIKTNNGSFLSVVAISFINGEKKMREMRFSVEAVKGRRWNVVYKETASNDVGSLRFVGHATNALEFVRTNNLYFGNGRDIPNKINDLIRLEASKETSVGMPADVISIYNNGYKRVINSGLCSESENDN